jgi:large subunit ribosomal protein L19
MNNALIDMIEKAQIKSDYPEFSIGDTLDIHTRIIDGNNERIQVFTGTIIARKGRGLSETISLYRVSYGAGIERVFMLNSPKIAKIVVAKKGVNRKAKLYRIRGEFGKKANIKQAIFKAAPKAQA